jgi:hypothetical protein
MKQTVYLDDFRQAFHNRGRGEQFSYEALELIYDYLEESDPDMELDVIAICCDFSEGDFQEVANELDDDEDELAEECEGMDEEDTAQLIAEKLEDKTLVLGVTSSNSIVYLNF